MIKPKQSVGVDAPSQLPADPTTEERPEAKAERAVPETKAEAEDRLDREPAPATEPRSNSALEQTEATVARFQQFMREQGFADDDG